MCSLHLGDPHVSKERDRERLSKWKCVREGNRESVSHDRLSKITRLSKIYAKHTHTESSAERKKQRKCVREWDSKRGERVTGKSLHIFIRQHPSKFTHEYGVFMLSTRGQAGIVTNSSLSDTLSRLLSRSFLSFSFCPNLPRISSEISSLPEKSEKLCEVKKFIGLQHLSNAEIGEQVKEFLVT